MPRRHGVDFFLYPWHSHLRDACTGAKKMLQLFGEWTFQDSVANASRSFGLMWTLCCVFCLWFFLFMLCWRATCCNHPLPVNQANLEGMCVSNYDRNKQMRNKALSGVAQLKKHPAGTTFYIMDEGREHLEWKKIDSMFFCWTALLWMPKVWQMCWRMSPTSTWWNSTCPQTQNSFFPWRTLSCFRVAKLVPCFKQCHTVVVAVGNWSQHLCFSPLFHCSTVHCSTVPLFHFPSIGMQMFHGSIVPCSIVPCVALFHLFHCPLRMHHSQDRCTHINMQWLVRTKQWVCGCKPLASFSGSLWWMKQMTWKSTKSWARQKWLTTRRLVCYMHYEQWVYVDQSQTNIIKKHFSRFEVEPNFALGRRPSCAMMWSPSQSSMGDSRRGPSSLGSLLRTVFDPCNHLGCL